MNLNLGCGGQVRDRWTNIDRAGEPPIVIHDLTEQLPYLNMTAECAVAHHVLDLLDEIDLRALLADVFRVLVPGGVLRVSSADHLRAMQAKCDGDLAWFQALAVPETDVERAFDWYLDCGGARKTLLHSPAALGELLEAAGFSWEQLAYHETLTMPSICDLDSREGESWYVEAKRP